MSENDAAQNRSTSADDPARAVAAAFPIADRKSWMGVVGIAVVFLGGLLWSVFGQSPQTVRAEGIIVPKSGFTDVGRHLDGTLTEILVSPGDLVDKGDVVARISGERGLVDVIAPTDGTVASILERIGGSTVPGELVLTMSSTADAEVAVAFVPAQVGALVKPGMRALVGVATYPESQFGTITGTVVSVSTLPATDDRIELLVGGNQSLVGHFAKGGPVLEVRVRLDPDPSAISGYRWTIGRGPAERLEVGTLATVAVVVAEGSPLSRFLQ